MEDVELPASSRLDHHREAEAVFDLGGETRRPRLVPSGLAIEDLHVHHGPPRRDEDTAFGVPPQVRCGRPIAPLAWA
jgi:hypothetical protein